MIGTLLAAATLAAGSPPDAGEAFARRQFLLEADTRCQLLSTRERAALTGSAQQARGALLRAGLSPDAIARRASDQAAGAACTSPDLVQGVAAARAAFTQWAAMQRQEFAGEQQGWHASRSGAVDLLAWTLWQDLGSGYRIGIVEDADTRAVVLALPVAEDGPRPRTVGLEFRDPRKWPDFVEPTLGGLFAASSDGALSARAAPAALCKRVWTGGAVEGEVQSVSAEGEFLYWTLPDAALDQLAALDPRDVARVNIEMPDNSVRTLYVEIGDLAAAMAFLAAGDTPSARAVAS